MIKLIRDHGQGIPDKDLQRVLEPYVCLEKSRNRHTGGTGLGLSIAQNIAHLHGGDLVLSNHKEGGLCATISIAKQS